MIFVDASALVAILAPEPDGLALHRRLSNAGRAMTSPVAAWEAAVALARIMMPESHVRLSAGRTGMTDEMQALCFFAGANSIFVGDTLLTAGNPDEDKDMQLLAKLGMAPMVAWEHAPAPAEVQLPEAAPAECPLRAAQAAGAVQERALVGATVMRDAGRHFLREQADAAATVELHRGHLHARRLLAQSLQQRRQQLDDAGVDHAEGESPARRSGIE